MGKLYLKTLTGIEYKEVPSKEGIVENSQGNAFHHWRYGQFSLELKIDSFEAPVIVRNACNLRIDVGEKVRLYSKHDFNSPCTGCGGPVEIDALEILGENDKVLFRYISPLPGMEAEFRE